MGQPLTVQTALSVSRHDSSGEQFKDLHQKCAKDSGLTVIEVMVSHIGVCFSLLYIP